MGKDIKVLVFHPAIAPYRISFFNDMFDSFDTTICLYDRNLADNKFDEKELNAKIHFTPYYFLRHLRIFGREFHLGHLKYLKETDPDLVIVTEYGEALWTAIIYRFLHRKKYKIVSICDDSLKIAEDCKGLRKLSRELLLKGIDGLILDNEEVKKWYEQEKKYGSSVVFPIIQDEREFRKDFDKIKSEAKKNIKKYNLVGKRIFLFVGRLIPEKNIEYLIDSFITQHKDHPENVLFIIGGESFKDAGFRERMEIKIDNARANGYILFLGRLEGKELKAWYIIAQVFVLPSKYEAFGAVVNEALLSGEYVMVSNMAGAACLVTEENGEIIDIKKPYIDFERACTMNEPLNKSWIIRESRMTFSFEDKMDELIFWLNQVVEWI